MRIKLLIPSAILPFMLYIVTLGCSNAKKKQSAPSEKDQAIASFKEIVSDLRKVDVQRVFSFKPDAYELKRDPLTKILWKKNRRSMNEVEYDVTATDSLIRPFNGIILFRDQMTNSPPFATEADATAYVFSGEEEPMEFQGQLVFELQEKAWRLKQYLHKTHPHLSWRLVSPEDENEFHKRVYAIGTRRHAAK